MRIRFNLRFLLTLTLMVAIGLAWIAWRRAEGRRHERLAAQLQASGCRIQFSHREWVPLARQTQAGMTAIQEISTLPEIVERWGFADTVRRISSVTIPQGSDMPTTIALLKQVGDFDALSFYDTGVTTTQLMDVLRSVHVNSLYLCSEPLPKTRMSWLNHEGLDWLCVARTQFSNAAINDLPDSLEYFDATRTRINDKGLDSFVRLGKLKRLKLCRTPTSEKAINALRQRMPWCEIEWEPLK